METIEVSPEAFAKLSDDTLDRVIELAREERFARVEHHADDSCHTHEPDEEVEAEGGFPERFGALSVGDIYYDGGRAYQVDDITAVGSGDDLLLHVARTMVDN